ncbi:MAG: TetR/AcrR family transcriptional regulator [Nocardioidaceae bacterium]
MTRTTQAERRAATRAALLDATVESLVEDGWAATTTRSVAQRAGVSQGAQQYHYPTKMDLVGAALSRLMNQLAEDSLALAEREGTQRQRAEALLDGLWLINTLPVSSAVLELINHARTDSRVAELFIPILTEAVSLTHDVATRLLPDLADTPGFDEWLLIVEAALRGTVMISALPGTERAHPAWPALRNHLLQGLDNLKSPQQ